MTRVIIWILLILEILVFTVSIYYNLPEATVISAIGISTAIYLLKVSK